ncbi:MAG: DUF1513 domain-containing protein [Proteobacteria bacterium]|nr:DUF1513 domain-containing protein [Pseudomonadota bacterium]
MTINRRKFITGVGAAAAASSVLGRTTPTAHAQSDMPLHDALKKFVIYGGGVRASQLVRNPYHFRRGHSAVLHKVTLNDEAITQTIVRATGAHYPFVSAKHDRISIFGLYSPECVILDMDHKVVKAFTAPEGYIFSGHGLLLEGTDNLLVGLYRTKPQTIKDEGMLMVINIAGEPKIESTMPSHGLQPHDMAYLPGKESIVLAHAGSTLDHYGDKEHRYLHEIINPGLTVLDAKTLNMKKFVRIPNTAEVSHLAPRDDGQVLCCLNQKLNISALNKGMADAVINDEFKGMDFVISDMEFEDRNYGISLPLPSVLVNLETGKTTDFMPAPNHQRQGQTVAFHSATRTSVVSYIRSGGLLFLDADGKSEAIHSRDIGLYHVSGLTDLPGTPYMAMCGYHNDISIVDMRTRKSVHTIRMDMLRASHIVAHEI